MTKLTGQQKGRVVRSLLLVATAGGLAAGSAANAVTQGTLGSTSTGSVVITATVPNRAQITSLSDINLTNSDPASAVSSTQGPCVWSNTATHKYTITATGNGTSGAFTLSDGTNTVPYSVGWAATAGASTFTSLITGTASSALTATATNTTCSTGVDSTLKVSIAATDLQSMVAANSYQGTLTLLVTPQ